MIFNKIYIHLIKLLIFSALCLIPLAVSAYDINEKFSVEGSLTGIYQYADVDARDTKDADRGAAAFDLGVNFHPTQKDQFQVTISYAAGNGLNNLDLFSLVPSADDLEDDLKDINGGNRDYLLEAWYKHTFDLTEDISLGLTGGIIDSTSFIDDNAFANDETRQFMNEAFVNHKNVNLPSYDLGGAAELEVGDFTIRGLIMNTKYDTGDDRFRTYNYYALQIRYTLETSLGEGNYRLYGFTTNDRFPTWEDEDEDSLQGFGLSLDQKLGEIVGVFLRTSWQDDICVVDHDAIYSSGVNINGNIWGREDDEIGIGYAYLEGTDNAEIDATNALETYVKFKLSEYNDITLDIQYINDDLKNEEDRNGFICGVRMNAYF